MKTSLPKTLLLLLLPGLLLCGCKKENDVIRIGGYLLRDQYGQPMGSNGNSDDDWQLRSWSSLSVEEQGFLGFADTISLNNTSVADLGTVVAYPNPVAQVSRMQFWAADSVKLKVALVDGGGRVHRAYTQKFKGYHHVMFDVADRALFPSGKGLRYYYSFSAAGAPHFKAGYGDIKVQ